MWIITEDGDAVDLAKVDTLILNRANRAVYASPVSGNGVTLERFESVDDAKNYIANLVDELNGKKPKLGYSFTWLSKVENLPPDKRDEFDSMVEDWLKNLQPADDKPKTFNDDGITW